MHKKKILFVLEKFEGGGVEKIAQIILNNFDYNRYDVTLLTVPYQDINKISPNLPVNYKYIFKRIKEKDNFISSFLKKLHNKIRLLVYYHYSPSTFSKLFCSEEYDIAIAFIEGYATRIVSGMSNIKKKIAWIHTDFDGNHWTEIAFRSIGEEQVAYAKFNDVICVSNKVSESAKQILGIEIPIQVLYNPIDVQHILKLSEEQISQNLEPDSINIISIGSLIPVKNYKTLLRAIKRLIEDDYKVNLYILGEGFLKRELEEYSRSLGIVNNLHLMGFQSNPYPFIKACDIYVCSSIAEGFNTAITEAMILGKPIVATDVSGVADQLGEENNYGIRVEITEEGLYNGMKKMMCKEQRLFYAKSAKTSSFRFNLTENMNKIYKLIES